jgi:hypothetical protein
VKDVRLASAWVAFTAIFAALVACRGACKSAAPTEDGPAPSPPTAATPAVMVDGSHGSHGSHGSDGSDGSDGSAGWHDTVRATAAAETFDVQRWSFPLDRTRLGIVDAQMRSDLARVLRESDALLVTNGGFFGSSGEPIGLAMVDGRVLSRFSPRLSGGVLVVEPGHADLVASESFDGGTSASFAIQCKPRLVVGGSPNVKRDDGQRAERTALCLRGGGRTLEVVVAKNGAGGPSLFALASYLATWGCEEALNLDGGPSTGVAFRDGEAIREERPRGPIRHAIVVSAR